MGIGLTGGSSFATPTIYEREGHRVEVFGVEAFDNCAIARGFCPRLEEDRDEAWRDPLEEFRSVYPTEGQGESEMSGR